MGRAVAGPGVSADSDGAFDVTVGRIDQVVAQGARRRRCPIRPRLKRPPAAVGYQHLHLDAQAHTATLDRPGMLLDLGGIAMGYTVDEVLKLLAQRGIRQALVDGSGDIGLGDPPPGEPGWRIGIAPPAADEPPTRFVVLANQAITTSGDVFQHVVIDGVRYSHIVNPHTGLGLTDRSSVTLIAPDCTTADSVTKAIAVRGAGQGTEAGRRHSRGRSADPPRRRREAGNVRVAGL